MRTAPGLFAACSFGLLLLLLLPLLLLSPGVEAGHADGADMRAQLEKGIAASMRLSGAEVRVLDERGECVPLRTYLEANGRIRIPSHEAQFSHLVAEFSRKARPCRRRRMQPPALLSGSHAEEADHVDLNVTDKKSVHDIEPAVWLASTVAIIIISLVGLLGVAVVPLVQRVFYNHILQFLVALAVGTLTGDALLHLLPHAISGSGQHKHGGEDERGAILKGLAALGGIYFFFLAEKLVALLSEVRAEKKAEAEERQMARRASRKPSTINDWRQEEARRRRSRCEAPGLLPLSSTSCEDMVTVGLSSHAMKSIGALQRYRDSEIEARDAEEYSEDEEDGGERDKLTNNQHRLSARVEFQPEAKAGNDRAHGVKILIPSGDQEEVDEVKIRHPTAEPEPLEVNSPDGHGHSHGHGHGHSHEVPDSIASVAWMVILGDGLHNFTDGLAIGAAFAKDITGGLSTSIAVFCHELPHELGDFAVLLKTGMSVRQAIFYNLLSSVLSFIGMLVGVSLGKVGDASFWILAITGGIFIYISLVDMLPELGAITRKPGESRLTHFLLQNLGLLTGAGIMLLIALFEENIKNAFG